MFAVVRGLLGVSDGLAIEPMSEPLSFHDTFEEAVEARKNHPKTDSLFELSVIPYDPHMNSQTFYFQTNPAINN